MWFKQLQFFQLPDDFLYHPDAILEKLESLRFHSCLPSLPFSMGWIPPVDEADAPLVYQVNDYLMLCLQIEEKILPTFVINQHLNEKIEWIEQTEGRKIYRKERLGLKDDITAMLLPRAFSKFTKLYTCIDLKRRQIWLGTTVPKKVDQWLSAFSKVIECPLERVGAETLITTLTAWVLDKTYPDSMGVEKFCLLQDPNQQNRTIRCQQQDLFAQPIQSVIQDGCRVKQLALCWQDRVTFTLSHPFALSGIKFHDEVIAQTEELEPDSKTQQFYADFIIMTGTLDAILQELLAILNAEDEQTAPSSLPHATPLLAVSD